MRKATPKKAVGRSAAPPCPAGQHVGITGARLRATQGQSQQQSALVFQHPPFHLTQRAPHAQAWQRNLSLALRQHPRLPLPAVDLPLGLLGDQVGLREGEISEYPSSVSGPHATITSGSHPCCVPQFSASSRCKGPAAAPLCLGTRAKQHVQNGVGVRLAAACLTGRPDPARKVFLGAHAPERRAAHNADAAPFCARRMLFFRHARTPHRRFSRWAESEGL